MQIEAIYDHGKLEFVKPLKLKRDCVRLVVTVPDEEVDDAFDHTVSEEVLMLAREMRKQLDAIRDTPLPPDDELPDLTEKQLDRIEAFALRDEIKGLR